MKTNQESKGLWIILFIIITVIFSCLAGCGSGGGGSAPVPGSGQIEISCADVHDAFNNNCDAIRSEDSGIYDAVFDSGILNTDSMLSGEAQLTNMMPEDIRIYIYVDMTGVCSLNNTMISKTFDMLSWSSEIIPVLGSGFASCASPGPAFYEVSMYNASHLPLDSFSGDPGSDELLYSVRVNFTYRAP
jgi:hypothetical protein